MGVEIGIGFVDGLRAGDGDRSPGALGGDGRRHGDPVVAPGGDDAPGEGMPAPDHKAVGLFRDRRPESRKRLRHGLEPVALLQPEPPGVSDDGNALGRRCDQGEHGHQIGHVFRVQLQSPEIAAGYGDAVIGAFDPRTEPL